ncbi:MAG: hypothetical protein IPM92_01865 [Saprospiraceae bacterium]|nr:hypothetical protein [Saprospiraceae bacterium]
MYKYFLMQIHKLPLKVLQIVLPTCYLIILSTNLHAQNQSSSTDKESMMIEALKEELIGNIQKSIDILEKLKYEAEFKSVSYYLLSRMYFSQGKKEEALNSINQSLITEPNNKWYLLLKSNIAENLSLAEQAAECNVSLYQIEPNIYTYYDNAAYHYLQAGSYPKAFEVLDKAELVFGLSPEIAIKKAFILGETQKFKKAVEILERCLIQYKDHQEIIGHLQTISQKSNDVKLKEYLQNKYPINNSPLISTNTTDLNLLDAVYANPNADIDTKIKSLLNILQNIDQKDTQKIASLQKYTNQLLTAYPTHVKSHCVSADLYFLQNNYPLAKQHYIQAIGLGNVPYAVWDNLLISLIELAHWNTCIQYSKSCLDYYPNQSKPYYFLALAYFKIRDYEKANSQLLTLSLMQRHKKNMPSDFLILQAKINEALKLDAQKLWDQSIELDSSKTGELERLLMLCSLNPEEFTLTQEKPEGFIYKPSFRTYCLLAELYYCAKNYPLANKYIELALSQHAFINTELHTLAANIYKQSGLTEKSNQHFHWAETLSENTKKQ